MATGQAMGSRISDGGARGLPTAGPVSARRGRTLTVLDWVERQALFIAAVAAVAVFSIARLPEHLNQDGWLALVGGRYVADHGIPRHDALSAMTHGARWIDQQWLAQLGSFELHQVGGLGLFTLGYVTLAVASFALAIAAARTIGATERHVLWVLPLAGFFYLAGSFQVRTQGFAYPLFVVTLWLLAKEVRDPSRRRVYLVFPLLVLWANLHGSVTVGVALAMLYGVTSLGADLRSGGWRRPFASVRSRSVIFIAAPALCLLATPYGVGIADYYTATLLNPSFSKVVTEWQPVTSVLLLAVPLLAAAFVTIWVLGRSGARTPVFDHLVLLGLSAAAVFALRNITWFGLGVVVLMPATISRIGPSARVPERRRTLNLAVAGASIVCLAGAVISVAVRPEQWFERGYDQRTLSTVAGVATRLPSARIFADIHFSDWLLWHDPSLGGRIAYDTRLELLDRHQLLTLADLTRPAVGSRGDILAGYGIVVLDPRSDSTTRILRDRPQLRVVLRAKSVTVAVSRNMNGDRRVG